MKTLLRSDAGPWVSEAIARGFGWMRDSDWTYPLEGVLKNGERAPLQRAAAAAALGEVLDDQIVPPLARLAEDVNYLALTPALRALLEAL